MQMLRKIIVINLSMLLLLSSTCIKPTADISCTRALKAIKNDPTAQTAYQNYHQLIDKYPYAALEQAEIILSISSLDQNDKNDIALWAASHLHPMLYKNTNKTVGTFAQDLLSQVNLKSSIIGKIQRIKRDKLDAKYVLTNNSFSSKEKTLLAEHFSMLIFSGLIDEYTTTFTRSEFIDDFTTFNDVGELEEQAYSKLIAIQEELLIKSLAAIRNPEQRERQNHTLAEALTQQRSNISTDYLHTLAPDAMERQIYESRLEDMKRRLDVTVTSSLQ